MKKLEGLVGDWRYEGEQVDPPVAGLPWGGAGKYFGTCTYRFVLNGLFLEARVEDNNPAGKTSGMRIVRGQRLRPRPERCFTVDL